MDNSGKTEKNENTAGNENEASVVHGIIKKVIFRNEENGFTILNIFSAGKFITASGAFFDVPLQDSKVKLDGKFTHHKKYGYQFNFTSYEISISDDRSAIIEYLSSNIFKGIGRVIAGEIYEKFKEKTLDVIDNEPEKLKEVNGIGTVKLSTVLEGLKSSYGLRQAVMFFKPHRFSDYQIKTIYERFKEKSIAVAKENPYLFTEIKGIGFKKADIMAEKLGIKKDDPNRIKEGIKYVAAEICENSGNCFVYYKDIRDGIKEIIEDIGEIELKGYINGLVNENKLVLDPSAKNADFNSARIYPPVYYFSELGAARELKRIAKTAKDTPEADYNLEKFLKAGKNGISLTEEQEKAVLNALANKISIISGGPGTGKSTVIKTIVELYAGKKIALTSLSGKAAQRLSDIVRRGRENPEMQNGADISTIHRLLKAQYDRQTGESYFTYNENNRLPHDVIVIDEMSMVDAVIFYKLLKAVKDETVLVLVGDVHQIPSVSPGDVLRDMIYPSFFPVTFLTKVFRQNEGGLININAHNLLNNKKFVSGKMENGKKEFFIKYRKEYDAPESGKNELLKDFTAFIKKIAEKRTAGIKNNVAGAPVFDDIQVLTPMRKGELGYNNLNRMLQDAFNPLSETDAAGPEREKKKTAAKIAETPSRNIFICNGIQFRLHDKIIQKRNNYDMDVFNGDTGYVAGIDHIEKTLSVDFTPSFLCGTAPDSDAFTAGGSKKIAVYDFLDVYENIMPAYALSIHKAQGSEFNNVIVLFHQSHYMMLKKNLLYTAITRGKKNVVIFGTFRAFGIAMNSKEEIRNSGLKDRLAEEFGG